MRKKKQAPKQRSQTPMILIVTILSLAAAFGRPYITKYSQRYQLEKEFAYSFCALKVVELTPIDKKEASYWYKEAKRIEDKVLNKQKINGVMKQMEKAYWKD